MSETERVDELETLVKSFYTISEIQDQKIKELEIRQVELEYLVQQFEEEPDEQSKWWQFFNLKKSK